MRNIDKLVKFLVNDNDKETLSKSTATDIGSVGIYTDYVIDRILPEDFLIQEGSHVEEKDLNTLVRNFNSLLKEVNLKPVIIEAMKRANIKPNQASALMSNLLPIIHEKIKILMGSASASKPEPQKEDAQAENETDKKKFSFSFKKKEKPAETEKEEKQEEVKTEEIVETQENKSLMPVEKIVMVVLGVCLLAVLGVLIFMAIKISIG